MRKKLPNLTSNNILEAAKWCFLNFGYSKTGMEDVAKRANVSRALIYKKFKNKEEIALAVFDTLLAPDYTALPQITAAAKSKEAKLFAICQVMLLEPWAAIAGAPMASEFFKVCEVIEPKSCAKQEAELLKHSAAVLGGKEAAELFVLSLYGQQSDLPPAQILNKRVKALVKIFTAHKNTKGE